MKSRCELFELERAKIVDVRQMGYLISIYLQCQVYTGNTLREILHSTDSEVADYTFLMILICGVWLELFWVKRKTTSDQIKFTFNAESKGAYSVGQFIVLWIL